MAKTPTNGIEPARIRLLADRLCYLTLGTDGLRWRHGMQTADRAYRDDFDAYAEQHAAELLPERREIPTPGEWYQPTLL